MNRSSMTAIIVEGEDREMGIIENMIQVYFRQKKYEIFYFPAGQNIYMLWKKLKTDDFETDIIEVLKEYLAQIKSDYLEQLEKYGRDDFAEIYLFFDYDGHQNNLNAEEKGEDVLREMLETFDNETENGKLYISYPMAETIRDYIPGTCKAYIKCIWDEGELGEYKRRTGENAPRSNVKKYDFADWMEIINIYVSKIHCLLERADGMNFADYRKEVNTLRIYQEQQKYIMHHQVFVLSAFPEFLLEYHKEAFWHRHVKSLYYIKTEYRNCKEKREI